MLDYLLQINILEANFSYTTVFRHGENFGDVILCFSRMFTFHRIWAENVFWLVLHSFETFLTLAQNFEKIHLNLKKLEKIESSSFLARNMDLVSF
jgi:hypothetical protein